MKENKDIGSKPILPLLVVGSLIGRALITFTFCIKGIQPLNVIKFNNHSRIVIKLEGRCALPEHQSCGISGVNLKTTAFKEYIICIFVPLAAKVLKQKVKYKDISFPAGRSSIHFIHQSLRREAKILKLEK